MDAQLAVNSDGHELMVVTHITAHVEGVGHPIPFESHDQAERFEATVAPLGRRCELRRVETVVDLTEVFAGVA